MFFAIYQKINCVNNGEKENAMDVKERRRQNLATLIDERSRGRQAEFANEYDINQGELSYLLLGKRPFGERKARTLERKLKLPEGWLDRGEEEIIKPEYALIPILDVKLACGNGFENGDNVPILGNWNMPLSFLQKLGVSPNNAEILFAHSYSMYPTIRNGSHVLIDKSDKRLQDGKIYAININGESVLKRVLHEGGNWILRSDNPDKNEFPDRLLPAEETTMICGRVVWYDVSL